MIDRLLKVLDALSQFFNVLLLPNVKDTNANESISGRSYRCGWITVVYIIDLLLSPFERNHCKLSYLKDIERAVDLIDKEKTEAVS